MKYWTRIQLAALASLVLNLALFALLPHLVRDNAVLARVEPERRAVRLNFQAPEPPPVAEPEPVKRLIDSGAPAEEPVQETDLISDRASQAQDMSDRQGDPARPDVSQKDDFDQMGTPPIPPQARTQEARPPTSAQLPEASEEANDTKTQRQEEPEPAANTAEAEPLPEPEQVARAPKVVLDQMERAAEQTIHEPEPDQARKEPEEAEPADLAERFEVAKAEPPEPVPVQELRSSRGRDGGGALKSGFTSFEANKHELGEYMLKVRNRVEREWRAGLQLRYSGVSRTYAIIECSIRPDGTLEYAKIVEPGSSLTYAVMCRQAIENAAPFGPFPFDVPEIYRTENLRITWKFSYM